MAGFAVNLELLLRIPAAKFNFSVPRGYLETSFLTHLIKIDELEPKAANCTKVSLLGLPL